MKKNEILSELIIIYENLCKGCINEKRIKNLIKRLKELNGDKK